MATYTPSTGPGAGTPLNFRLLIDPPSRETRQTMSERVVPGSTTSIVDRIGKAVTKIRGTARFDSYSALKTFEGVVGTGGSLVYSEEPSGITVEFVGLQRQRVAPHDIHLASVEFWIIPPSTTTTPAVRAVTVSATAGGTTVNNILSARVSYGFDQRTGECRLVTAIKPTCTYDDQLTVVMGAGGPRENGTTGAITRFVGVIRDFEYQAGAPTVTTVAHGYLIRAIEYENGDETLYDPWTGHGGLFLQDLLGTISGSSSAIVKAVLTRASVPYSGANILGSSVNYGTAGGVSAPAFMWHSGGSGVNQVPMPQEQGETAMSYIERYDAIDAEVTGPNTGGRYRTFETLAGVVFRLRVGGRPQAVKDFTLYEGTDVLAGNFTRSISNTRNRFVVKGMDRGEGFGPLSFEINGSNDFQPAGSKHTYMMSSDMIERATNAASSYQASDGMSCETLATALELEYNREIVSGWVETWRDDAFGIAQTHEVRTVSGIPGSLGVSEKLWVQSLEISVDSRGFTQRVTYLGGGIAESTTDMDVLREGVAAAIGAV